MMEDFIFGVVVAVGVAVAAVAAAVLCAFGRKKKPQPLADSSAEPTDVIIDDPRKGFTFDDPYQSIDISDEVKTLSSAESGDSAFDTSPNDSGHDIQVNGENPTSSTVSGNEQQQFSSPSSAVNSNTFSDSVDDVKDEPVYEMIAFEGDGGVNHNPTPDVASSLRQDCDVSDLQTYEDVGGDVQEEAAKVACGSQKLAGEGADPGLEDDDVFETEPPYTPVYESSIYVDCASRSSDRKDSGVVLDMVPSPTESTPRGPASTSPFCTSHGNALSRESSESSNNTTDAGLHWASIKSQVNELKKLKKLKASASLPHEEGGGGCPEVPAHSDAATEDRGAPSSPHAGCHPVPATPVQSGENILSAAASPEGTAKLPTPSPSECGDGSTNTASTPKGCDGSPQGTVPLSSECRDESTKLSARDPEGCDGSPQDTVPLPSGCRDDSTKLSARDPEGCDGSPQGIIPLPLECRDDSTKLSARAPEDCDGSPQGIIPLPSECRDDSTKLSARDPEGCDGSPQSIIPLPSGCRDDSTKLSARDLEEDCNGYPAQCATVPESSLPEGSLAAVSPRKSSVQSQDGTGCVINTPRRGSKPVVPPKPPRKKQL